MIFVDGILLVVRIVLLLFAVRNLATRLLFVQLVILGIFVVPGFGFTALLAVPDLSVHVGPVKTVESAASSQKSE